MATKIDTSWRSVVELAPDLGLSPQGVQIKMLRHHLVELFGDADSTELEFTFGDPPVTQTLTCGVGYRDSQYGRPTLYVDVSDRASVIEILRGVVEELSQNRPSRLVMSSDNVPSDPATTWMSRSEVALEIGATENSSAFKNLWKYIGDHRPEGATEFTVELPDHTQIACMFGRKKGVKGPAGFYVDMVPEAKAALQKALTSPFFTQKQREEVRQEHVEIPEGFVVAADFAEMLEIDHKSTEFRHIWGIVANLCPRKPGINTIRFPDNRGEDVELRYIYGAARGKTLPPLYIDPTLEMIVWAKQEIEVFQKKLQEQKNTPHPAELNTFKPCVIFQDLAKHLGIQDTRYFPAIRRIFEIASVESIQSPNGVVTTQLKLGEASLTMRLARKPTYESGRTRLHIDLGEQASADMREFVKALSAPSLHRLEIRSMIGNKPEIVENGGVQAR